MAKKKTQQAPATSPAASSAAPSSSSTKRRLVTLTRPRLVANEDWQCPVDDKGREELPEDGVVMHDGQRCFIEEVG